MKRPVGVTIVGAYCLATGIFLFAFGTLELVLPKSLASFRFLAIVYVLKRLGPYFALASGTIWCVFSWGLFQLRDWARLLVSLLFAIEVPAEAIMLLRHRFFGWHDVVGWIEIALRVLAVIYLHTPTMIDSFNTKDRESLSAL